MRSGYKILSVGVILLGLLASMSVFAQSGFFPKSREGKLYDVGKVKGEPRFIQKTTYDQKKDGDREVVFADSTIIATADKKTVLREKATIINGKMVEQTIDQIQACARLNVLFGKDKITYQQEPIADCKEADLPKKKTDSIAIPEVFVSGPTAELFLRSVWPEIVSGKEVRFKFSVPEILDTVGFKFFSREKILPDAKEATLIMKPSNFIVAMAVPEIVVVLDPKRHRYIKYIGRTPLFIKDDRDIARPYDSEILYQDDFGNK